MADVKLFSKNTRIKKELERVFSLSKNKSSESAKPGGPEPETTRNRQGVTQEESKHASFKCYKDEIRNVGPQPAPGIRCSNEESARSLLPTCLFSVFCGCPGFPSTHRWICPLWSTCRDLCWIICRLVFRSRKLEPLELTINECDNNMKDVLCIWKRHCEQWPWQINSARNGNAQHTTSPFLDALSRCLVKKCFFHISPNAV